MTVTAVMLMGAKPEPFLGACLDSIRDAVDRLIVNDNSGSDEHPNLAVMRDSELYRSGRVTRIPSAFLGFGPCRDLCLAEMRKTDEPGRWIIFVDCDEVHVPAVARVTRRLLPKLPERIGIVDGYNYNIFQSPELYKGLDHRHNLMFRFRPEIRWTGQVHEKLEGLQGRRLVVPYRYFHYGYLAAPETVFAKWEFYGSLGDERSGRQSTMPLDFMRQELGRLSLFHGRHPDPARPAVEAFRRENGPYLAEVAALMRRRPLLALRSRLRWWQIAAKMHWLKRQAARQLADSPDALAELDVY